MQETNTTCLVLLGLLLYSWYWFETDALPVAVFKVSEARVKAVRTLRSSVLSLLKVTMPRLLAKNFACILASAP